MATWIVTCPCGSPTKYHCSTCGENLCSNCKKRHSKNKNTRHHSVIEHANKLMPGEVFTPICQDHNGQECLYWCQECKKSACVDCVTSRHNGHMFTKTETVRTSLQKHLKRLESTDLKKWTAVMVEAQQATLDYEDQVNRIEKKLDRAIQCHKKVVEILENNKRKLEEETALVFEVLREQEKGISEGLEKVKQKIRECEDRLRSTDVESLLDDEGAKNIDVLPAIFFASPPVFTPSEIDSESLTEMFGKLVVPKSMSVKKSIAPETIKAVGQDFLYKRTSKSPETEPVRKQTKPPPVWPKLIQISPSDIPTTKLLVLKLVSKFPIEGAFPIIACVGSGHAWVKTEEKRLQLVDRNGSVKDTIDINFKIDDMAVLQNGDLLLSDTDNNSIKSISCEKVVKTLFKTKTGPLKSQSQTPRGLCCLQSGEIAVTFPTKGRVVIYSMSGKIIKELDKKLFTHPYRIAQSKVNSDLYIADKMDNDYRSAGNVVALDKDYNVRYKYNGGSEKDSFSPCGLCTDSTGHVLITDTFNNDVHLLDKDGKFQQKLLMLTWKEGLENPYSIDVDCEENVWVGEQGWCFVKVAKYLE